MITISFVLRVAATAAAAFVSSLVLPAVAANAAEIKVLSSVALTSALDELAPVFEHSTDNKLVIGYGIAAQLRQRLIDGETTYVVILTQPLMDDLQKQGKLISGSLMNVGAPLSPSRFAPVHRSQTSVRLMRSNARSFPPSPLSTLTPRRAAQAVSILPVFSIVSELPIN
jgi:hypothetical protein